MREVEIDIRELIVECLQKASSEKLRQCLEDIHPVDIALVLPSLSLPQRVRVLRALEAESAAEVLIELEPKLVAPLVEALGRKRSAEICAHMLTDDAADLLGEMPEKERKKIFGLMAATDVEDVQELLSYEEDTAGGLMATEYVAISQNITIEETIAKVRQIAREAETVYYVYVVNEREQLVGVASLRELILAEPSAKIEDVMSTSLITVNVRTDQEEVARAVAKYDFLAIPVVNDDGELLGIITVDDVLDVIEEEATEDIMRLAANIDSESQDLDVTVFKRALRRLPWLIILMFGSLLAGNVIAGFESTLEAVAALAFFITVMAGGPGNVATQSLTVVVRGLATGEVDTRKVLGVIFSEARVGLVIGISSGVVLSLIAWFWLDSSTIGLVVGLALMINMTLAAVIGTIFPLLINRFGIDPALASGPFITTVMDVTSMLVYFKLATHFLRG